MGRDDQAEAELRELLIKAQDGDQAAYRDFLRQVGLISRRYLRRKMGDVAVVDDVIQEVLIGIHKAKATYDPQRPITPWVVTIVKYKYVDYLRKWSRTSKFETQDEALVEKFAATDPAVEAKEELSDQMRLAIAALPEKQRIAVTLLKIDGLSVKEAATKMGASESAVKVTAHRGYKALRKRLRAT